MFFFSYIVFRTNWKQHDQTDSNKSDGFVKCDRQQFSTLNVKVLPPLTKHFRQALYKMETGGDSKQSSSRYIWSGRLSGLNILFWDQSLIYKSNNNVTHCRFTQL